jgi:uncharacterized protein (DUF488 family)
MVLFTIGFTGKSLREFIGLLRAAGVDGVVDVRLRNTSQLAGYAKRDDLAFILETFSIGYMEEPRLAPTDALLDTYHRDHDWGAYVPAFQTLLAVRPLKEILDEIAARFEHPCLLCAEPTPDRCHRRLVAEAFAQLRPGLEVRHLVAEAPARSRRRRAVRMSGLASVPDVASAIGEDANNGAAPRTRRTRAHRRTTRGEEEHA